jgi:DNA primase large subunit
MDALLNARYPFTSSAKKYAETLSLEMGFEIIEKGRKRAEDGVLKKRIPTLPGGSFGLEDEIRSYAIARMVVSQIGGRAAIESYAIAEAKRASAHLKSDSDENVLLIAKEFGLSNWPDVPVLKYLAYAPREAPYKLVNMSVKGGRVHLSKNELIRVLEEAIKKKISGSLPLKMASVPPAIKRAADEIRSLMPKPEAVVVFSGKRPPCIQVMLEKLGQGENLSHSARLALTIFLLKSGMAEEAIAKLFSTSPDFDERITSYQVSYIKKKGYSMPSCSLMDSHGHCVYRCKIRSPLAYKG